jgi:penicillin-binding protein activator
MKTRTILLALLLAAGCSSVSYTDPVEEETFNVDWGRTDQQRFAQAMTASLIESPNLAYFQGPGKGDDLRVITYMGGITNETHEHLNTQGISDSIRTALVNSGKFRFVVGEQGQYEIGNQVDFQQGSGRVNPAMIKQYGKQLGADVILYGALRSIQKEKGRSLASGGSKSEDVYYQFVLNCVNIETAEIIWTKEEELSKKSRIGLFGSS